MNPKTTFFLGNEGVRAWDDTGQQSTREGEKAVSGQAMQECNWSEK